MNSCITCGGAIFERGKVYGYAGPSCYCAEPKPRSPYYITIGGVSPVSGGGGGYISHEAQEILRKIAELKKELVELTKKIEEKK